VEIAQLVVLMLENRSFDSMLGQLYPGRADFDGLAGHETNEWNEAAYSVWVSDSIDTRAACIPAPDPSQLFCDMTDQIFGVGEDPSDPFRAWPTVAVADERPL
jgi:phospholipase C